MCLLDNPIMSMWSVFTMIYYLLFYNQQIFTDENDQKSSKVTETLFLGRNTMVKLIKCTCTMI